ncbi:MULTISPECIES: nicotinamide riboside transporter PnuC [Actinomadura]|jgi:nicotinamide mononucleotide transporter|uniref:Nicotinamide mononucleotide transporter n=1 Tax=Actinomadura citrea TaxID=46158 RepID=A0A7Y9GA08_9ACTN|nr:nicotinamide riboside transporter PnuC [Actinomadura citrea]NYE12628.1 nicotinamide mononucleotide transporter [Actinomadura citrea]GGT53338.1 membrane protein [Actinomadura citrea]
MNWLGAGFEVFGEHILWTDLAGNVLSLAVVWLAMRKTLWTWPVQLVGALLLLAASLHAHVPGNALKQILFCGLALYGWFMWTRGRREADGLAVRQATARERAVLLGALVVGTAVVAELFVHLDWLKVAWSPWANAYIFVGSAVATFAQSRALVDFWIVWVLVDLVGVPLALKSGLYVSGAVYGIFFVMVMVGFRNWLRESRSARNSTQRAVTA